MVTNEPIHQRRIHRQFDSFCKTVLRNAARDIYREINRQNKTLIVLSALNQDKLNQLIHLIMIQGHKVPVNWDVVFYS